MSAPRNEELLRRIRERTAKIAVIGLGYVGLPLVRATIDAGFGVIGLDIDKAKIDMLNRGETYIRHLSGGQFQEAISRERLAVTTDFSAITGADVIIICVPTPLTHHRDPDLSYVVKTAQSIAPWLRAGQLIVLESTTYPGTTREVLKPILETPDLISGRDFFLAFSPEREDPGNANYSTTSIPKVVGGDGDDALGLVTEFYSHIAPSIVPVSSMDTAEAVKLTENIFRAVNIALVNELKLVFHRMGIDVWEVIEAAKTKPFGYMPFYPGPGLGGHCIPIDPFYLSWKAREFDMSTRFIELAGEINASMPQVVLDRVVEELNQRFVRSLNGSRGLFVGLAYKKNVDDVRESPGLRLIELFERRGAHIDYHDPYVPSIRPTREFRELAGRRSVDLTAETVRQYDFALIVTDHDIIDYKLLVDNAKLIVDTRNAIYRSMNRSAPNVAKA